MSASSWTRFGDSVGRLGERGGLTGFVNPSVLESGSTLTIGLSKYCRTGLCSVGYSGRGEELPVSVRDLVRVLGRRVRLVPLAMLELLATERIDLGRSSSTVKESIAAAGSATIERT
jgi:hypothetical protein